MQAGYLLQVFLRHTFDTCICRVGGQGHVGLFEPVAEGLGVTTFFTPKIPAKPFLYWGRSGKRSNSGKATSEKGFLFHIEELFTDKAPSLLVS